MEADNETDVVQTGSHLEALQVALRRRLGAQVRELEVVATERGLVLRGRARTYYAKQLAQEALLEKTPQPLVANEIAVDTAE
jgi:hypothetical protein